MPKPIKKIKPSKEDTATNIFKLCNEYKHIIMTQSFHSRSSFLHELRDDLRPSKILFGKRKVLIRALESTKQEGIKDFTRKMVGEMFLVFTNDELENNINKLDGLAMVGYLSNGDELLSDVVINTGEFKVKDEFIHSSMAEKLNGMGIVCCVKFGKIIIEKEYRIKKGKVSPNDIRVLRVMKYKQVGMRIKVVSTFTNKLNQV